MSVRTVPRCVIGLQATEHDRARVVDSCIVGAEPGVARYHAEALHAHSELNSLSGVEKGEAHLRERLDVATGLNVVDHHTGVGASRERTGSLGHMETKAIRRGPRMQNANIRG